LIKELLNYIYLPQKTIKVYAFFGGMFHEEPHDAKPDVAESALPAVQRYGIHINGFGP
jgi:hypothetical protein